MRRTSCCWLVLGFSLVGCAVDADSQSDELASSRFEPDAELQRVETTFAQSVAGVCADFDYGDSCEWVITYANGETEVVDSCTGFEANVCCEDPIVADLSEGITSGSTCPMTCDKVCYGSYQATEFVEDLGESLRGFPTFYQHRVDAERSRCPEEVAVGCGPIAAAEVLSWFDQLGFNQIGDPFRSGGELDWRDFAETLRSDYLDTYCNSDSSTSSTSTGDLYRGISDYLDHVGVDHDIWKYKIRRNDVSEHFGYIQEFVEAGHPVILGYCSKGNSGEGIQERLLNNDDCGSHWGVIVGWDWRDDGRYVNIVTGWGSGDNHTKKFEIETSTGYLTLIYVAPDWSDADGDRWCAADDLSEYYQNAGGIGYWAENGYDDYPVVQNITGTLCDRIGGDTYESVTRRTSSSCEAGRCEIVAEGDPVDPFEDRGIEEIPDRLNP